MSRFRSISPMCVLTLSGLVLLVPTTAAAAPTFSVVTAAAGKAGPSDRRPVAGGVYDATVNRTFISWAGSNTDNYVQTYDNASRTISSPLLVGAGAGDPHNYPTTVLTDDGHLLVFRAMHNIQLYMARSNNPDSATSFTDGPVSAAPAATYPMPLKADNGDVYVFYRETMATVTTAPIDFRPMQYIVSSDNGRTFTNSTTLTGAPFVWGSQTRPDNMNEIYAGQIRHEEATANLPERFSMVWTLSGGGPGRHQHDLYHKDLYFAYFTPADRHFHDAAGDDLGPTLVEGTMARCLVVTTGYSPHSPNYTQLVGSLDDGSPVVIWTTSDSNPGMHTGHWNGTGWDIANFGSSPGLLDMERISPTSYRLYTSGGAGVQTYTLSGGTTWTSEASVATPSGISRGVIITDYVDPARMILEGGSSIYLLGGPANQPPPRTPPGPATSVTAAPAGAGQVMLSWSPPANTGSGPVTAYAIYAYSDSAAASMVVTANPSSAMVTGLSSGANYTFTLSAWNGFAWGQWSGWSQWVTVA